jgi:hypothetical protein
MGSVDLEAVRRFSEGLAPDARILDLSRDGSPERELLESLGYAVQPPPGAAARDLRLLSLSTASWDAAWCNRAVDGLEPTEIQRVLIALFQGLKPGGRLFACCSHSTLSRDAWGALLRQSGFRLLLEGQPRGNAELTAFLTARV